MFVPTKFIDKLKQVFAILFDSQELLLIKAGLRKVKYKSSSYLLLDIFRKSQVNSETSHFAFTLIRCLDINDNCNFKVQCEKKNSSKILSLSSFLKELLL